jgi:hypothetical protein
MKDEKSLEPRKSRTSPAAETSDPPASAFLERRPLKQEGSLAHPVNGYLGTKRLVQILVQFNYSSILTCPVFQVGY